MQMWTERQVLLIESNTIIRSIMTEQLAEEGVQVVQAASWDEAWRQMQTVNFDLFILDVETITQDGTSFLDRLGAIRSQGKTPFLVLGPDPDEEVIRCSFEAGAISFFERSTPFLTICTFILDVLFKKSLERPTTILVVDDSAPMRQLVSEALHQAGYATRSATNGQDGLMILEQEQIDLILMDLNMPVMDGFAMGERIRQDERFYRIPYVVISDVKHKPVMRRMIQRGASAYLVKPFNIDQLVVTVEKLLSDSLVFLRMEREHLELERTAMLGSIMGLARALEARDPYTRTHSSCVAGLTVAMGRTMGFTEEILTQIETASILHDIGKIGVPDHILHKPGSLTVEEFECIKTHPATGAEIIRPIPSLAALAPVVHGHHERFDGRGYPAGLKGQAIPLWARMLAIADTYNALTSDRPYRRGVVHEQAMEIVLHNRGTQFCPECVEVFVQTVANQGSDLFSAGLLGRTDERDAPQQDQLQTAPDGGNGYATRIAASALCNSRLEQGSSCPRIIQEGDKDAATR